MYGKTGGGGTLHLHCICKTKSLACRILQKIVELCKAFHGKTQFINVF